MNGAVAATASSWPKGLAGPLASPPLVGARERGGHGLAAALAITVYVEGPLSVLEAYLRAERSSQGARQRVTGGAILGLSVLLIGSTVAASLVFWLPRLT